MKTHTNNELDGGFNVPEPEVARRLGLTLDDVRERRGVKGADWNAVGRGHRMFWTEAAVMALAAHLAATHEKRAPIGLLPDPDRLVVVELTRTRTVNDRIVIGRIEGGNSFDPLVTVVVGPGRSQWFLPRMRVMARRQYGSVYNFEGNPDKPEKGRVWPRSPGRW
jgi:hypothetical protein